MLFRKLLRDLQKNKIQFFSIFLMSFLGIYVFVGIDSESTGMTRCENRYYEEYNLADLWVAGQDFESDALVKIRETTGVKAAMRMIRVDGKADLPDEPTMTMNFIDSDEISKMYLVEGTPYQSGQRGVYLDYYFAKRRGYAIGDTLPLKLDNTSFSLPVVGIFYSPEYVYYLEDVAALMPNYGKYGVCYMDVSEFPLPVISYNLVQIDAENIDNTDGVSDEEKIEQNRIAAALRESLEDDRLVVTGKDDQLSYQTFRSEMNQHSAMAFAFPIVFVLISLLGIITTMTRLMAKQRVQIGTMKALGFSTGSIILHYISYGFVLSFAGCILGAIVGYYTLPDYIIDMFTGTYILPYMSKGFSTMSFYMILMMVFFSTLFSYIACRRECALIPAEALKPASPQISKASALERSRFWQHLSFSTQWNLRDIIRNKMRTLMGIVGVVGCAMLLFSAFGCLDSVDFVTKWMYGELNTAKIKIIMSETADYGTTEDYAKQYHGQMIQNSAVAFEYDAGENVVVKNGTVTIVDQGNFIHFQDEVRNPLELKDGEIAITLKMAQALGAKEGSIVNWHLIGDDNRHSFRIKKINRNPSAQGITMTRNTYEGLDYKFVPTEILTNVHVPTSLSSKDEIVGVKETDSMMDSLKDMMAMMYSMAGILIGAAAILGIVVLYNLGVLSMVEKRREMATLKVLGYTTGGIRGILAQQNLWVTIIGIVFGYPAGFAILKVLFNDMPETMDYTIIVYSHTYAYTFALTFLISFAVNRVMSREVKTIDMVEALKGE